MRTAQQITFRPCRVAALATLDKGRLIASLEGTVASKEEIISLLRGEHKTDLINSAPILTRVCAFTGVTRTFI